MADSLVNMQTVPLALPRLAPIQRFRQPKKNIPQTAILRNKILLATRKYVQDVAPVPPLPADEIKVHADNLMKELKCDPIYRDYVGVLLNNEMWRESLATVPFERRLLLLPKCLRIESKCPAPFDEFGLLCKQCGLCSIQDLQAEAERLGYAVLVAEGSAIVMSLIQTGKIEAIVGVSCLSVLERAFPYMEAAAIPGVAVPLLQDDCIDTTVDLDWVWDYIHLTSDDKTHRLDLGALREEVDSWFTVDQLATFMGTAEGQTESIAREWLCRAGKRWRPFLTVATFQALNETPGTPISDDLKKAAVAVECFHKASLIHDDIEDNDAQRYGESALHEAYGIPVALNVGDLLIGEGYRLLSECSISASQRIEMLQVATAGQRQLCQGQGAELCWTREPRPLSSLEVLDIFRRKTAPAFEVALRIGAIFAAKHSSVADVLGKYSEALGIAYQIRDDVADFDGKEDSNDSMANRPNILMAIATERAQPEAKAVLEAAWKGVTPIEASRLETMIRELKAEDRGKTLLETYKEEAIRALRELDNPSLKGLLRRVVGKIFNDTEIKGWCKEFEEKNAVNRLESVAPARS